MQDEPQRVVPSLMAVPDMDLSPANPGRRILLHGSSQEIIDLGRRETSLRGIVQFNRLLQQATEP